MIVVWRVATRCNLACAFDAYDKRLPGRRSDVDAATVAAFAPVLASYSEQTGDPMLWLPVFEMSHLLTRQRGIRVSATTNGCTLHVPAVRRCIADHFTGDILAAPPAELTSGDAVLRLHQRFAAARARDLSHACRDCPSTQVFAKFASSS